MRQKLQAPTSKQSSCSRAEVPKKQSYVATSALPDRPSNSSLRGYGIAGMKKQSSKLPDMSERLLARPSSAPDLKKSFKPMSAGSGRCMGETAVPRKPRPFSAGSTRPLSAGSTKSSDGRGPPCIDKKRLLRESFKPALFVSSCGPLQFDAHSRRRISIKSFQGSLGEAWVPFSWRCPPKRFSHSSQSVASTCTPRTDSDGFEPSDSRRLSVSTTGFDSGMPSARSTPRLNDDSIKSRAEAEKAAAEKEAAAKAAAEKAAAEIAASEKAAAEKAAAEKAVAEKAAAEKAAAEQEAAEKAAATEAYLAQFASAGINAIDGQQFTALHLSAQKGLVSVCSALLERVDFTGADARDASGRTALHVAAAHGHAEVCRVLLQHPRFSAVGARNNVGCTALHCAACSGCAETCGALLDDLGFLAISDVDRDGETALHWAAWNGNAQACLALLEHNRFEVANYRDKRGRTAFYLAALHGRSLACRAILEHPRFDAVDMLACDGSTALEAATLAGHEDTRRMLTHGSTMNRIAERNVKW